MKRRTLPSPKAVKVYDVCTEDQPNTPRLTVMDSTLAAFVTWEINISPIAGGGEVGRDQVENFCLKY